jgi:hypothetical protein
MFTRAQIERLLADPPEMPLILECRDIGRGLLETSRCPLCGASFHIHGAAGGPGHRAVHCTPPPSLYRDPKLMREWKALVEPGYYLKIVAS